MKTLNIIDMKFTNNGHFVDDACLYSILNDTVKIIYHTNGIIKEKKRVEENGIKVVDQKRVDNLIDEIKFLAKIFKEKSHDDLYFITSASYISLIIYSILWRNFNYYILIHFVPTVRTWVYKIIIKLIVKRCNGTAVLADFMQEHLSNSISVSKEKINVIHSREICLDKTFSYDIKTKGLITFIGAFNSMKDLMPIRKVLEANIFLNLKFKIVSQHVSIAFNDFKTKNNFIIEDRFVLREEFDKLIKQSNYVLIPYKQEYGVRFSGLVFDAIKNGSKIIASNLPQFNFYVEKYDAGYIYRDESELVQILNEINTGRDNNNINNSVYKDYSKDEREKRLKTFLKLE